MAETGEEQTAVITPTMTTLSAELTERAQRLAKENPETRQKDLDQLRTAVSTKVPEAPTDDVHLLRFLRACVFKHKETLQCIKIFYKLRVEYQHLFTPVTSDVARQIVEDGLVSVLPGRDKNGARIILVRVGRWDPSKNPMVDLFRLSIIIMLKLVEEEETQIGGIRTLEDMHNLAFKHVKGISLTEMKKICKLFEEALPVRFEGFHHLNESKFIDRVYTMMKPFLSASIKQRNCFHGTNMDQLESFIDKDNLPEAYGGKVTDQQLQDFTASLLNNYGENGNDYGMAMLKISNKEQKVNKEAIVDASASGNYKKIET